MGGLMTSVGLSTACHADPAKLRMSLARRENRLGFDVRSERISGVAPEGSEKGEGV
jgi:hypothetical protein